jgi:hypothetical protein
LIVNTKVKDGYPRQFKVISTSTDRKKPFKNLIRNSMDLQAEAKKWMAPKAIIEDLGKMDIFLEKDFGTEYQPERLDTSESFVDYNKDDAFYRTKARRMGKIRQRSKDTIRLHEQASSKKRIVWESSVESKKAFMGRHDKIRDNRLAREQAEMDFREKRWSCVNWIYFLRVYEMLHEFRQYFKMFKFQKMVKDKQHQKICNLQNFLRDAILGKESPEVRHLIYTKNSVALFVKQVKPKIKAKCKKDLGIFFKGLCSALLLSSLSIEYVLQIKSIQKKWRYTMGWRRVWEEKWVSAWEKEIMNVNEWEDDRAQRLAARKFPKDKFIVANNLMCLSGIARVNFSDYLLDLDILNYID